MTKAKAIPRKISQADLLSAPPLELLRRKLLEVRTDREAAREKGSFSAVASLHRLEAEILRQCVLLEKPQAQEADPLDALSDEELEALASGAQAPQEVESPTLRLVGGQ